MSVCPHCGMDRDLKEKHDEYRRRISSLVIDNLEEVTNVFGGVIGYKLNLTDRQAASLCRKLKQP